MVQSFRDPLMSSTPNKKLCKNHGKDNVTDFHDENANSSFKDDYAHDYAVDLEENDPDDEKSLTAKLEPKFDHENSVPKSQLISKLVKESHTAQEVKEILENKLKEKANTIWQSFNITERITDEHIDVTVHLDQARAITKVQCLLCKKTFVVSLPRYSFQLQNYKRHISTAHKEKPIGKALDKKKPDHYSQEMHKEVPMEVPKKLKQLSAVEMFNLGCRKKEEKTSEETGTSTPESNVNSTENSLDRSDHGSDLHADLEHDLNEVDLKQSKLQSSARKDIPKGTEFNFLRFNDDGSLRDMWCYGPKNVVPIKVKKEKLNDMKEDNNATCSTANHAANKLNQLELVQEVVETQEGEQNGNEESMEESL